MFSLNVYVTAGRRGSWRIDIISVCTINSIYTGFKVANNSKGYAKSKNLSTKKKKKKKYFTLEFKYVIYNSEGIVD